jgi:hypothetical protein
VPSSPSVIDRDHLYARLIGVPVERARCWGPSGRVLNGLPTIGGRRSAGRSRARRRHVEVAVPSQDYGCHIARSVLAVPATRSLTSLANDGETSTGSARPGRLDSGVEGEVVRLGSDGLGDLAGIPRRGGLGRLQRPEYDCCTPPRRAPEPQSFSPAPTNEGRLSPPNRKSRGSFWWGADGALRRLAGLAAAVSSS